MDNIQSAIKADKIIGGLGIALLLTLVMFTYNPEDLVGAGTKTSDEPVIIICNDVETTEYCCSELSCKTHIPCSDLPEGCKAKV
jgi:hypothetical protein